MKHTTNADIRRMQRIASAQAERVLNGARYVVVTDGAKVIDVRENAVPSMEVFAVVGSARCGDVSYERTVLFEIGRKYSRPYHRARLLSGDGVWHETSARQRFVPLTKEALCLGWDQILSAVMHDAWRMRDWKRATFETDKRRFISGVTFTVSQEDKVLLAAVLQSELALRSNPLIQDMQRAAEWIAKRLKPFEHLAFAMESDREWRKMMRKERTGVRAVLEFLAHRNLLPHHHHIVQRHIAEMGCSDLYARVLTTLGVSKTRIEEWGTLLALEGIPKFTDCYVWCKPFTYRAEYRGGDGAISERDSACRA